MTLVVIFGPPAVAKMTVGMEIERRTGLRLFHNHMTVDPVLQLFPYGSPSFTKLVRDLRCRIFEEVALSDLRGMIFTYVWALDDREDKAHIDQPLRLTEKKTKRDIENSRRHLIDVDRR